MNVILRCNHSQTICKFKFEIGFYLPPLTTTVNEHMPMFPEGSSKDAVTMIVPSVKLLPDAELTPTRLVIPELSVASGGVNVTAA